MRRSAILWLIVMGGVGAATALRIVGQWPTAPAGTTATTRPAAGGRIPDAHDYVAEPIVHPAEEASGPTRIVSMAPSLTETCCALGLLDRLVGRTAYCIHPAAVREVPEVGAIMDANLELLASIQPEIILINQNSPRVRDQLAPLKLPFEEVTDDSLDGIFHGITRIGQIAGRPRTAAMLNACLRAELDAIAASGRTDAPKRVLIVLDELPVPPKAVFVAGPELFLSRLVTRLGHHNAAAELVQTKSGELSLEQLVAVDPDIILEVRSAVGEATPDETFKAWAGVGPLRAVRDRAIRSYGTRKNLVPSPRINIVFHQMATTLAEWR
ncbi:MAG: ABC transporter substrate-binding protein [Phycisphaerae bacterium]|nr:ABC transporter substrate-binding protein [Phycisphaerae bacterium]